MPKPRVWDASAELRRRAYKLTFSSGIFSVELAAPGTPLADLGGIVPRWPEDRSRRLRREQVTCHRIEFRGTRRNRAASDFYFAAPTGISTPRPRRRAECRLHAPAGAFFRHRFASAPSILPPCYGASLSIARPRPRAP